MKSASEWFKHFADDDAEYITEEDILDVQVDVLRHVIQILKRRVNRGDNMAGMRTETDDIMEVIKAEAKKLKDTE